MQRFSSAAAAAPHGRCRPPGRRTRSLLLALRPWLLLVPWACHPSNTFTATQVSQTRIAAGATPSSLTFPAFVDFDVGTLHEVSSQGIARGAVRAAAPLEAKLRLVSGAAADITFVRQISVFATGPGLPRLLVAQGGPFLPGAELAGLNVEDAALAPYLQSAGSSYEVETQLQPVGSDVVLELRLNHQVTADELRTGCSH